jgi:hypothetical protein
VPNFSAVCLLFAKNLALSLENKASKNTWQKLSIRGLIKIQLYFFRNERTKFKALLHICFVRN